MMQHTKLRDGQHLNQQVAVIDQTIDKELHSSGDRMIMKLYLENYDVDDIARFAGLPRDEILCIVNSGIGLLEHRLGCFFSTIQITYRRSKFAISYG